MYLLFDLPFLAKSAFLIGLVCYVPLLLLFQPQEWLDYLRVAGLAVSAVPIVIFIFGNGRVFWRLMQLMRMVSIYYPDINGTWKGVLKTNYPIIEQLKTAAKSQDRVFDPEDQERLNPNEYEKMFGRNPIVVRIKANLFTIELKTRGRIVESNAISVRPRFSQDGREPTLIYVYEAEAGVLGQRFLGAAVVKVIDGEPPQLIGDYWTNRAWRTGSNAAGRIELSLISRDPDAPVSPET